MCGGSSACWVFWVLGLRIRISAFLEGGAGEKMLRKRSRPTQKEQDNGQMTPDRAADYCISSDASVVQKARSSSFFSVPGLFVGLSTKVVPDSESVRSPTSPLDYKLFSNLSNTFIRSPRSSLVHPKSWDCGKVGLGLVDSLRDETKPHGNVLGVSESKNILFGSQIRINISSSKIYLDVFGDSPIGAAPKSLPEDYGISSETGIRSTQLHLGFSKRTELNPGELGKIHSCSADISRSSVPLSQLMYEKPKSNSEVFSSELKDCQLGSLLVSGGTKLHVSGSLPININSSQGFTGSLSASDIELSEDYTCIISHGPNPKTTHIFGDCILESCLIQSPGYKNKIGGEGAGSSWVVKCSEAASPLCPSDDFLSFCFSCKKKLEEGKDIYMYRGDKAFCSCNCREQEILIEEVMEKPTPECSISPGSSFHDEIFPEGMVVSA